MDALASEEGELKRALMPAAAEPRSLRTAEDGSATGSWAKMPST